MALGHLLARVPWVAIALMLVGCGPLAKSAGQRKLPADFPVLMLASSTGLRTLVPCTLPDWLAHLVAQSEGQDWRIAVLYKGGLLRYDKQAQRLIRYGPKGAVASSIKGLRLSSPARMQVCADAVFLFDGTGTYRVLDIGKPSVRLVQTWIQFDFGPDTMTLTRRGQQPARDTFLDERNGVWARRDPMTHDIEVGPTGRPRPSWSLDGTWVDGFRISGMFGGYLVYHSSQPKLKAGRLYAVPLAGGSPILVSSGSFFDGSIFDARALGAKLR